RRRATNREAARFRDRSGRRVATGGAAHAHGLLRRNAQVRRAGSAVGGTGGRARRHLQPGDDHVLAAHGPAPPHGPYAAGAVPATVDAAAAAVEPGGAGAAIRTGPRGRRDARPGARSRPAAAHRGGVRRRGGSRGRGRFARIRTQGGPARRAQACGLTSPFIVVAIATTIGFYDPHSRPATTP